MNEHNLIRTPPGGGHAYFHSAAEKTSPEQWFACPHSQHVTEVGFGPSIFISRTLRSQPGHFCDFLLVLEGTALTLMSTRSLFCLWHIFCVCFPWGCCPEIASSLLPRGSGSFFSGRQRVSRVSCKMEQKSQEEISSELGPVWEAGIGGEGRCPKLRVSWMYWGVFMCLGVMLLEHLLCDSLC